MPTILIVDDEVLVRNSWGKALRHGGYHVLTAANAEEALTLCDDHNFDVVVLDFIMPPVDGVSLLVKIRKQLPFVRSLIVSGQLDTDINQADLSSELKAEVEADRYLHKPLSNDQLREAVADLLNAPGQSWKSMAEHASRGQRVTAKKAKSTAKTLKSKKKR